ncbi:MAG: phosphotransferase family protein, partial [Solirubrobacteraceae bacterium]
MTAARGGPRADSPARRTAARRGVPTLAAHLDATYEIEVTGLDQLDLGVYRVDRSDGPSWVVRVFPAIRPRALGWWLGALHALGPDTTTGAMARPGGAWHHLADGSPRDEAGALTTLVDEAGATLSGRERTRYDAVRAAVEELDTGDGLPTAFTHPDFVMANVVAPGDGTMVLIDWSGAGQAPRACALGFLLWSVGFGGDLARVDRAVDGYRRRVQPE